MNNRLFRKGLVLGIIALFIGAGVIPSTSINVEKKSFKNTSSRGYIQDLIDNASDGDTIYIPSGTYYETIIIDKSISLIGEDRNTTIIDGNDLDNVVFISTDSVNISGFTIQNCSSIYQFCGIVINSNYNNITDNNIINNNGIGICLSNSWYNTIEGNSLSNYGYIYLENSSYNKIKENTFSNASCGMTLQVYSSYNLIEGNTINDGAGIYLDGGTNNIIIGNNIINNDIGLIIYDDNSTIENNIFSNKYYGIELHGCNNIISNKFVYQ